MGTEYAVWSQTTLLPRLHTHGSLLFGCLVKAGGERLLGLRVTLESGRGGMVSQKGQEGSLKGRSERHLVNLL